MKKILVLLLSVTVSLMLTSCLKKDAKEDPIIKAQPSEGYDKPVKTVTADRTVDISDGINISYDSFSYSCDFDYDGNDENVGIIVKTIDDSKQSLCITIGSRAKELELFDGFIKSVYSCDIDLNDGVRDLAVITVEGSSDPRIRILNYADGLPAWNFADSDSKEQYDSRWIGYAISYYFNVNDDDTITLEEQTNSYGMWSVYRDYKLNANGAFEEIVKEKYDVLPDFMVDNEYFPEYFSEDEIEMWKKGYIMAHEHLSNGNITIHKGEYFRPLYDDDHNKLYIEKKNGEQGYIDLENFPERYIFNDAFFYLAG